MPNICDLICTNFRTDDDGPKGKGFKIIITAYNDGKYSPIFCGFFHLILYFCVQSIVKSIKYEQLAGENMSLQKLTTQSRSFHILALPGYHIHSGLVVLTKLIARIFFPFTKYYDKNFLHFQSLH